MLYGVLLYDKYADDARREGKLVERLGFESNPVICELMWRLDSSHSVNVCKDLNSINDQGIEVCVPSEFYYVVGGERVHLSYLSTSEQLFLLGYACKALSAKVYLCSGYTQLLKRNMLKFLSLYRDSPLVFLGDEGVFVYKRLLEGLL